MRYLLSESSGLLIDVQTKFTPHIAEYEAALQRMKIMVKGLLALEVPLAVTEQNTEKLGPTVPELAELFPDFQPMNKMEFSCFGHKPYAQWLKQRPCKNVVVFGIETHVCVLQTAVDLRGAGYNPIVVWDAVSSRNLANKAAALERFRLEGIATVSSESILFELMESFEHPAAKTISSLVK